MARKLGSTNSSIRAGSSVLPRAATRRSQARVRSASRYIFRLTPTTCCGSPVTAAPWSPRQTLGQDPPDVLAVGRADAQSVPAVVLRAEGAAEPVIDRHPNGFAVVDDTELHRGRRGDDHA